MTASVFGRVCALGSLAWTIGCGPATECPPTSSTTSAPATVAESASAASVDASAAELTFRKDGQRLRTLSLADLVRGIRPETVKQLDPYYNRDKTYRAVPLSSVLELGFKGESDLASKEFVLRAKDGYTVPLRGTKMFEKGAYVAYEDVEVSGWEPIGQQRANPAPFYLVWAGKDQTNLETHPRPYQLVAIEIARFEDVFPRTVPSGLAADHTAQRGFSIFREQCIHCHAINRQGGRVGPELNVPQSVVEYRPVDQIKAYVKNPLTFRYSTMPAHPSMTDADLDAMIAYFTAMKDRKQDDPASGGPAPVTSGSAAAAKPSAAPSIAPPGLPPAPPVPGAFNPLDERR